MPLPLVVVGGGATVVDGGGVCPMTDTQTQTFAQSPPQVEPTDGFHLNSSVNVMPFMRAMSSHVWSVSTKAKASQLFTIPDCIGIGVSIPFVEVGLVEVDVRVVLVGKPGSWPMMLTQTYTLAQSDWQLLPTEGFHSLNWASVIPLLDRMLVHDVSGSTKTNRSQLSTISGCVGEGVTTPLVGVPPLDVVGEVVVLVVVVGGGSPNASTQYDHCDGKPSQLGPIPGFLIIFSTLAPSVILR
jgi:hypothetical protein